jgi:hypothetical protein
VTNSGINSNNAEMSASPFLTELIVFLKSVAENGLPVSLVIAGIVTLVTIGLDGFLLPALFKLTSEYLSASLVDVATNIFVFGTNSVECASFSPKTFLAYSM